MILRSGGSCLADARLSGAFFLRLRSRGNRRHGRVPVKQAAATVAGEQLALAKLIPHLRTHTHAAAGALLIIDAGDAGAAGAQEPVVANEDFVLDMRAKGFALKVESG
jgi:hypothetical protein